jgi:hypothetical protein
MGPTIAFDPVRFEQFNSPKPSATGSAECPPLAASGFVHEGKSMGKKNRKGNREPKKPKQIKASTPPISSVADLGKQGARRPR